VKGNNRMRNSGLLVFPNERSFLFHSKMAKLAISVSSSASSGGSEHEMNPIAIVYFSCQTFFTNVPLVDQNLDMRIKRP